MRSFLPFFRQRRSAVLHHQVEICFGHSAVAQTFRAPSAAFCEGVLLLAALHLEKTDAGSFFAVKTTKLVGEEGAAYVEQKKEETKKKRAERNKAKKSGKAAEAAE